MLTDHLALPSPADKLQGRKTSPRGTKSRPVSPFLFGIKRDASPGKRSRVVSRYADASLLETPRFSKADWQNCARVAGNTQPPGLDPVCSADHYDVSIRYYGRQSRIGFMIGQLCLRIALFWLS